MKLTILNKKENPLLERVEVKGKIVFEGVTPSNQDVRSTIAKELGKEESLVVVKHIFTQFSKVEAEIEAVAYSNQEAKIKTEKVTKHLRKKMEEEKKKAEETKKAEAEVKEAEKPVEEEKPKKTEKPAETSKEEQKEGEQ